MAHVLTITINAADGIVITDAAGNEGGDLKVSTGDDVKWVNNTGRACKLKFKMLKLGNSPSYGGNVWPFKSNNSGNDVDIPGGGAHFSDKINKSKVSNEQRAAYVKYDVHVTGHGKPLDPIIIIER